MSNDNEALLTLGKTEQNVGQTTDKGHYRPRDFLLMDGTHSSGLKNTILITKLLD